MSGEATATPSDDDNDNDIPLRPNDVVGWHAPGRWRELPADEAYEIQKKALPGLHSDRSQPLRGLGNKALWKPSRGRALLKGDENWRSDEVIRFGVALRPIAPQRGNNESPMNLEIRVQSPRRLLKKSRDALRKYLETKFGAGVPIRFTGPVKLLHGFDWYGSKSLKIGADLATENGVLGPVTCFVRMGGKDAVYALACGHVLSNHGQMRVGRRVLSPSGLTMTSQEEGLGTLEFVQSPETDPQQFPGISMDAGLVDLYKIRIPIDTTELNSIPGRNAKLTQIVGLSPADVRTTHLEKTPAASPSKTGIVGAIVSFLTTNAVGDIVTVRNAFEIEGQGAQPFAKPGDSGALLVDSENRGRAMMIATAVNVAGKNGDWDNPGYIYSLSEPFEALSLRLV
ncbi:MAG: hypothetical protein MRY64_06520 [Hyphomonadaceae bacterium]|nr:hypothetical protein [Hyphomonadaceae bacterium]